MRLFISATDIWGGDAVGNHCLGFVRNAKRLGFEAYAFAQNFGTETGVRPISNLFSEMTSEDVLLVSYSIYDQFLERLLALPGRKICYFHGVTDPQLLREFDPSTAEKCALSAEQYPLLAQFDELFANSIFITHVLSSYLDINYVKILPPIFPDMPIFQHFNTPRVQSHERLNLLVVGRVVPHKRIEDAIDVFAQVRAQGIDAKLSVVGSTSNQPYLAFLSDRARDLGVEQEVHFAGAVDQENLFRYFDEADALLLFSRHEGFCVPVLEAMYLGLPVFVRGGTAASEVGEGAVVVFEDIAEAAQAICKMYASSDLRLSMIQSGQRRAKEILSMVDDERLKTIFQASSTIHSS